MKKLLMAALTVVVLFSLCSCEDPEKQDVTTTTTVTTYVTTTAETSVSEATTVETIALPETSPSETTTSKVGGFIVREEAPGNDIEWDEIGNAE